MIPPRRCLLLALAALSTLATAVLAQAPSLDLIEAKALAQAKRIHSIKYQSKTERRVGPLATKADPKPKSIHTSARFDYVESLHKFRGHLTLIPDQGKPLEMYSRYDGQRYQSHEVQSGGMVLANAAQTPNPTLGAEALIFPYLFLMSENAILTHDLIRDDAVWRKVFAKSKYLNTIKAENLTRHLVQMPGPKPDQSFTAEFAEELDYFPYRTTFMESGRSTGFVQTLDYARLGDAAELIVFPTQLLVILKDFKKEPATFSEDVILTDRQSISINQDVPDDAFTIPMAAVKVVNDVDRKTQRRVDEPAPASTPSLESTSRVWWIVGAVVSAVAALGLILAVVLRRRSPSAS